MHSGKYIVMIVSKAETCVREHTKYTRQHTHGARRHVQRQRTNSANTYSPAQPWRCRTVLTAARRRTPRTRLHILDSNVPAIKPSNTTGGEEL